MVVDISSIWINKTKKNLVLPSTKFIECHTVIRNSLKSSPNFDIKAVWADTSYGTNLQYDQFQNTKQVLKSIQQESIQQKQYPSISRFFFFKLHVIEYMLLYNHTPH